MQSACNQHAISGGSWRISARRLGVIHTERRQVSVGGDSYRATPGEWIVGYKCEGQSDVKGADHLASRVKEWCSR